MFSLILMLFTPAAFAGQADYSRVVMAQFADQIFASITSNDDAAGSVPDALKDPSLTAVTREFGPAVIPMSKLPIESEMAQADVKPWSSWWFPKLDKDLFESPAGPGQSPLEKYDAVRSTISGEASRAADFEKSKYSPDVPRWEGLCDAWAIAAVLFPEPVKPRTLRLDGGYQNLNGVHVTFSVSDQKALLMKTVDAISSDSLKVYGQKFLGDYKNWIYPDIFPQELHRFIDIQLFQRKKPFIMDHDPGVEVWNEPVYKANYVIQAVPDNPNAVFVKLFLYSATSLRKDEENKTGIKEITREYDYYLYGTRDANNNLTVTSGVWTKTNLVDSRRDHPDYVFTIPDPKSIVRKSFNPEIDPKIVDQIVPGGIQ